MKNVYKCFYIEKILGHIQPVESYVYVIARDFGHAEEIMMQNENFYKLCRMEILGVAYGI